MNLRQDSTDTSSIAVKRSIAILKEHLHLIFVISVTLAAFSLVIISLLPNIYRATTTILVDPQKIPERYVASTVTADPNERLNTLTQQVLSSSRLGEIIDRNNLYSSQRRHNSREEIIDYMRKQIKIELVQGSDQGLSSFTISYDSNNRWQVASITNQLAASFINWNEQDRQQQARDTAQFLSVELERAREGLEQQESALQSFKMRHVGATPDQLDANLQALSRLQSQLQANMDAISRLDEERLMLTQAKPVAPSNPAEPTEHEQLLQEKTKLETQLLVLKRQFTDTYPDVITTQQELDDVNARLAALPTTRPNSPASYDADTKIRLEIISKELDRHRQEQASIQQQIASYQGKVDEVPVLETQMTELTRNYETSRQNYQSLLDKTLSAGMSQDLERKQQAERFIILDVAKTPSRPIQPKRLPLMAAAVPVAFLIVSAVVVGVCSLLGKIQSEDELRMMLPPKTPILGTIPPITSRADAGSRKILILQSTMVFVLICAVLIAFFHKVKPIL